MDNQYTNSTTPPQNILIHRPHGVPNTVMSVKPFHKFSTRRLGTQLLRRNKATYSSFAFYEQNVWFCLLVSYPSLFESYTLLVRDMNIWISNISLWLSGTEDCFLIKRTQVRTPPVGVVIRETGWNLRAL